ncbi:sulfatase [Halosimplex halophilum]|uniref:sulfatase n=1 Tax=Halosimplex halophilum TaxID=2559572 RepID=UPI00107F64F1|nr:sulfatase [Halosimplex halophilum]
MSRPNVLFVVLDSVRADRLSSYGYERETTPGLDAFAAGADRYTRAVANSSWTMPAHGTFFTGRYPSEHGAGATHRRFSVPPERTLPARLSAAGYETVGLSTNPWVATDFDFDTGFDEFADVKAPLPFDPDGPNGHPRHILSELGKEEWQGPQKYPRFARWALDGNPLTRVVNTFSFRRDPASYADASVLNDRALSWIDGRDRDDPFFMFLNYMDAHEPYHPDEEWLGRFREGDCEADIEWHLRSLNESYDDAAVECINDRYDACLAYLDDQLATLFAELDARGLREETAVVVTADHGKCLGEHEFMGVGTFLYDELLEVPLLVDRPGEDGGTVDELTDQADVHDLILDIAGLDRPHDRPDGAFSETLGPNQDVAIPHRDIPAEGRRRIETDEGSLVVDVADGDVVRVSEASQTGALRERLDAHLDQCEPFGTAEGVDMDSGVRDQLEELGYL